MGEYAKYKGKEIKIGTCEDMYYIRFEDRLKVQSLYRNVNTHIEKGLRWRLPIPDEDRIEIGEYENHTPYIEKSIHGNGFTVQDHCRLSFNDNCFEDWKINYGWTNLRNNWSGLVARVKCYHGLKLNESKEDTFFRWQTKKCPLCLYALKNTEDEIRVCYICLSCNEVWSAPYNEIQPHIQSVVMKRRIYKTCLLYWEEIHGKNYPYPFIHGTGKNQCSIYRINKNSEFNFELKFTESGKVKHFKELDDALSDNVHVYF